MRPLTNTKKRLVAAAVTALSCCAVAAPLPAAAATTPAASASGERTQSIGCWVEYWWGARFEGSVEVSTTYYPGSNTTHARVTEYRIKQSSNLGGNSANINIHHGGTSSNSPDSLIQDGSWHDLDLGVMGSGRSGSVEFVFDMSGGPDPRCEANYTA